MEEEVVVRMEEQQRDLRQLVMKRAADRSVAGSGMASPAPRGEPLIQQVIVTCGKMPPSDISGDMFIPTLCFKGRIFLIANNCRLNSSTSFLEELFPTCMFIV